MQDELVVPTPLESDGKSTRFSLFYDRGSVYATPGDFAWGDMRSSAGLAFLWYTPFLGILDLSYAFPLNDHTGDRIDRFQINFRSPFF
jgi:outer membrane protein insertion porin family